MSFLEPVKIPRPKRTVDASEASVVRSYLALRTAVGIVGIGLPLFLVVGDSLLLEAEISARGSLSAYYHSGVRDVFVAVLSVTAVVLVTYKLFERNLDNTLSIVAGVAAAVVALFPTERPAGVPVRRAPIQSQLGEGFVGTVHWIAAAILIVSLGIICYFFGVREGSRSESRPNGKPARSAAFWSTFHRACAATIALAVLFIIVTQLSGVFDSHSLLIGESIAVLAFGASWLMKGLELDILLGRTNE